MKRAAITVENLSKVFSLAEGGGGPVSMWQALRLGAPTQTRREVEALVDVSFSIGEGERVGIIGANGAGKTTLLSILAGVSEPTSGRARIEGDVHAMLSIGAVLRDDLTGRDNILLDVSVHGREPDDLDGFVEQVIAFSELGEFIDRPVRTYSSGMKARLAFSMGAFINPDVLIIDETLSVGDAFFSVKASKRMAEITAQGRIVLLVSHSLGSITQMCTRCLWLDQGRLVMDGDPKTVTGAYENAVRQSDERDLALKFGAAAPQGRAIAGADGLIGAITLRQKGVVRAPGLAAMVPLSVEIEGEAPVGVDLADLTLEIIRVDGRMVWRRSLADEGLAPPRPGPSRLAVDFDPFFLGASLFRLDVRAQDRAGASRVASRVFEVIDEEGQFGGVPLVFYPPVAAARPLE